MLVQICSYAIIPSTLYMLLEGLAVQKFTIWVAFAFFWHNCLPGHNHLLTSWQNTKNKKEAKMKPTERSQQDIRLTKPAAQLWLEAQQLLKKTLSQPVFEGFIKSSQLVSLENNLAVLAVNNDFVRGMIANNHLAPVSEALSQVNREKVSVKVIVDPTLVTEQSDLGLANISIFPESKPAGRSHDDKKTGAASIHVSHSGKTGLNSKHTFNTFVVGAHNRFCHSAALAVAENPGQSYNPLFLYGGVGLGKTHIMQAIGHEVLRLAPHLSVRYMTCERFTNELINSIRDDRMVEFRKRYRQIDVLLMDDIQFIQGKESTQEEFFHTFNTLKDNNSQIVLSSDRPPKAISLLEERLRSRFEWGLIADIQAPDLETRVAILRKKCEVENMRVSEDVIEHIATMFTANIRELEGALIRAHAYSNMTGTELSVRSLTDILAPAGLSRSPGHGTANITLDKIIEVVAQHYSVEPSEMRSAKRSPDLALPRHIAMYMAHDLIQLSFPRIGQAFANRKHTSAMYAHSRIKEAILKEPALAETVNQITRKLQS